MSNTDDATRYRVQSTKTARISTAASGYYSELLIYRQGNIDVAYQDHLGRTGALDSNHENYANLEGVHIILRHSPSGARSQADRRATSHPVEIDTISIFVSWEEIQKSPVYVSEVNMLFAVRELIGVVRHPNRTNNYMSAMEAMITQMHPEQKRPFVTFIANDSLGRLQQLYVWHFGQIFRVPVSNCDTDRCCMYVYLHWDDSRRCITVALDDLFDQQGVVQRSGCVVDMGHGEVCFLGLNPAAVIQARTTYLDEQSLLVPPAEIDSRCQQREQELIQTHQTHTATLQQEAEHAERQLKELKRSHDLETRKLKNDLETHQQENRTKQYRIEELQSLVETMKSTQAYQRDYIDGVSKMMKSRMDTKQEDFKYWSLLIKTTATVTVAVGSWYMTYKNFSKK